MSGKVLGTSDNVLNDNSYRLKPQNINSKIMVTLLTKETVNLHAVGEGDFAKPALFSDRY